MKKLLLIPVFLICSFQSFAIDKGGLFLEPMVTYERGTGDVNLPAPFTSSDSKVRGFGAGLRLGGHILETVFLGVDGRYSWPTFKESSALGQDTDAKQWNAGPFIGMQLPFPVSLRIWGEWLPVGELDPKTSKGVDEKFKSGNGWRVGAGFKLFMVSLNAEYQHIVYDKVEFTQVGIFNTNFTNNTELKNNSLILSVSFPMDM